MTNPGTIPKTGTVSVEFDIDKLRGSLVGNGYLPEDVAKMSEAEIVNIVANQFKSHIEHEYDLNVRWGLYKPEV